MTQQDFNDFSAYLSCSDRKSFIQNYLNKNGLDAPVICLENKNHIYVNFPKNQYNQLFKIKTIIAHYDIFPGSPGANDNSAADFVLMKFAAKISKTNMCHNMRIIFTDGEELGKEGINQQGAYALAKTFKKLGITEDDIFVFDCMGRGNIPVICENHLPEKMPAKLLDGIEKLENKAEKILKNAAGGKWYKLPCSYSDNASFIVNGIPAIAITMLPLSEINDFLRNGTEPETWKMFHTKDDCIKNLNAESFDLFERILDFVAAEKSLR